MKYFAYGSNMNWDDLDKWCEKHGYSPIDPSSLTQRGFIKDYKLVFNHYSKSRKGGALNITRSPGDKVCGIVFTLSNEDFQKIRKKEGSAYKLEPVNVFLTEGGIVGAKTFKAKNNRELHPPTEEYLKTVLEGARKLGANCLEQIKKAAQETKATPK